MIHKPKHLLTLNDLSRGELVAIVRDAIRLKRYKRSNMHSLDKKMLVMIFSKPSTRTRVSFEVAMVQLGGHAISLDGAKMQTPRGESLADTAKTLSRYADAIMARVYDHSEIVEIADNATIPVINGLSNSFHPCQTLADIMTIHEKKGKLAGLNVAWIGDGNNVCNSLIYGCAHVGMNIKIATPKEFKPDSKVVKESKKKTSVTLFSDPILAIRNADVVVTDTFSSIHNTSASRRKKFLPKFRITEALMKKANPNAIFMHCLPAKRGQEVVASIIDGKQSVVWDEAENRLYTQKALLLKLLK